MKKILLSIFILLYSIISYSQKEYDVRKSKWGMSIQEVINSEYPLEPSKKEKEIVEYEDVWIGEGFYSKLEYKFKNKKLTSFEYTVRLKNKSKKIVVPLTSKISMIKYVFDIMKSNNYKCNNFGGWGLGQGLKELYKNINESEKCDLTKATVEKIEKIATNTNEIHVYYSISNERNNASFCFYEFQNSEITKNWAIEGNLIYTLSISPNSKLKKELNKNAF
jgi:hypothetical protein